MGSQVERTQGKAVAGGPSGSWQTQQGGRLGTEWSHIHMQINWEEQLGIETD